MINYFSCYVLLDALATLVIKSTSSTCCKTASSHKTTLLVIYNYLIMKMNSNVGIYHYIPISHSLAHSLDFYWICYTLNLEILILFLSQQNDNKNSCLYHYRSHHFMLAELIDLCIFSQSQYKYMGDKYVHLAILLFHLHFLLHRGEIWCST